MCEMNQRIRYIAYRKNILLQLYFCLCFVITIYNFILQFIFFGPLIVSYIDDSFFLLKKKQTLSIIGITRHGKISTEKKKVLLQQLSLIS